MRELINFLFTTDNRAIIIPIIIADRTYLSIYVSILERRVLRILKARNLCYATSQNIDLLELTLCELNAYSS